MEKPKRRTTRPGLGDSGLHQKVTVPPPSDTHESRDTTAEDPPEKTLERKIRRNVSSPPEGDVIASRSSAPPSHDKDASGRRPRLSRAPVRVDDVGDAAVLLGARHGRAVAVAAPRVLRTRRELENAPINHRDAFVLSLIDGKTSVQGLVDLAAMPDGEVVTTLARLAALGIISMP